MKLVKIILHTSTGDIAIFHRVVSGLEVLDKIAQAPVTPVKIVSVSLLSE